MYAAAVAVAIHVTVDVRYGWCFFTIILHMYSCLNAARGLQLGVGRRRPRTLYRVCLQLALRGHLLLVLHRLYVHRRAAQARHNARNRPTLQKWPKDLG